MELVELIIMSTSTGYGPSIGNRRLLFDGDERKFELWYVRFLGHLRLRKLYDVVTGTGDVPEESAAKNAEAFAEIVQFVDDRSLSLIMRDAIDDGRKAMTILKEHYMPKGKPRVITLYTELTSLHKNVEDSVTDYIIRAENIAAALNGAGETISDGLLVAMVLKGLPDNFKPFTTVITQRENPLNFAEFKVALRNFEDQEKVHDSESDSSVLNVQTKWYKQNGNGVQKNYSGATGGVKFQGTCHSCGIKGHKSYECRKNNRWCDHCRNSTHDTKFCRRLQSKDGPKPKDSAKSVEHSEHTCSDQKSVSVACESAAGNSTQFVDGQVHSFLFKISVADSLHSVLDNTDKNDILVDCGATTHIVNDQSKFFKFDDNFNPSQHFIELADGSKTNNLAMKRGDACVNMVDDNGHVHECVLQDALFVPSFSQSIFSVQSAVEKGAKVEFNKESSTLVADGTKFKITKSGKLYYLHCAATVSEKSAKHTLQDWHEILGHCNNKDVLKLNDIVEGMTILNREDFDCGVCLRGKMTQNWNRNPDKRATSVLHLVHFDLAGPIEPISREGFKYVLGCVDDFSGLIALYFLKKKSDTFQATEKFLADVGPYGSVKRIRSDQGGEFISDAFESLLIKNKIKHERSAPYSPHQNGTVERSWRSLFEMTRCLLLQSGLPKSMWTYALMSAMYIRNRCYNPRTKSTPFESFTGCKPNIAHMQKFGSTMYMLCLIAESQEVA